MSGFSASRRRDGTVFVFVRFLLATGWGAAIDPSEARANGVAVVLAKPYHRAELVRALSRTDAAA